MRFSIENEHVASVGPVLESGDTAAAVVRAILRSNEGVSILDRGSYLRVRVPKRCVVSREEIEHSLGQAFRLPADLERIMPSFKGKFTVTEDLASWTVEGPP